MFCIYIEFHITWMCATFLCPWSCQHKQRRESITSISVLYYISTVSLLPSQFFFLHGGYDDGICGLNRERSSKQFWVKKYYNIFEKHKRARLFWARSHFFSTINRICNFESAELLCLVNLFKNKKS